MIRCVYFYSFVWLNENYLEIHEFSYNVDYKKKKIWVIVINVESDENIVEWLL